MSSLKYDPSLTVPQEIADLALKLKHYMEENHITSIYGMGDIYKARRDLRTALSLDHSEPH